MGVGVQQAIHGPAALNLAARVEERGWNGILARILLYTE